MLTRPSVMMDDGNLERPEQALATIHTCKARSVMDKGLLQLRAEHLLSVTFRAFSMK